MGIEYDMVCDERRDRYELGKGLWSRLLGDDLRLRPELKDMDREAFAEFVAGFFVYGEYARRVGGELFDFCSERGWEVRLIRDDSMDDEYSSDFHLAGTRYTR